MAMLTGRNLPDAIYRALRVRAAQYGRSAEAEVSGILLSVVKPASRVRLGDALAASSAKIGLTNKDLDVFQQVRVLVRSEPPEFG